ncbi:MAG: hypothetical protein JNM56_14640 [Planctomycetia bacterium]|nr:hypothetical protein [Planctomycetia bacterium]
MDAPQPDATPSEKSRKSTWETVLTTTPVVLTVIGTVLAGLSSSEMTLAQYYRTLAAQSQSKAANQWNFFQVKRIRGTSLEVYLDLLPAPARMSVLDAPSLLTAANAHLRQLRRVRDAAGKLQLAVNGAQSELGGNGSPVNQAAARLVKLSDEQLQAAEKNHEQLGRRARTPEAEDAFALISSRQMPRAAVAPIEHAAIAEEVQAMSNGQDSGAPLTRLNSADIDTEIHRAEGNTRNVELALEAPDKVIDELGKLVRTQLALSAMIHQAAREAVALVEELPESETKLIGALRRSASDMQQRDVALIVAGEELKNLYKAADHGYTARRYRWEADFNRQTAQLYELQVRKQSQDAERHRERSRLFFFGLLFAQAGTAISTTALAARKQSMLWAIASLAGIAALGFSLFVYLAV